MKRQLISEVKQFQKIAGLLNENWHPDDPASVDLDDMEDEDPEDFDDISEEEGEGTDYDESSDSESEDTDAMGGINEEETPEQKAARQWMNKMVWTLVDRGEDQIEKMYKQGGYQHVYSALKQSFLGALGQQGKDTPENQALLDKSLTNIFKMMGFVKSHKGRM